MKYKLKVYTIWELGARSNQEDAMFPRHGKACDSDRTFVLCDGMGGHSAGEVASQAVCEAMGAWITGHCPDAEGDFSDADFEGALAAAFDLLDERDDGSAKKMGTTMTFLKLHAKGATIAHIGDSRVYHIRPGGVAEDTEILFQTRDHSLVNDLIRAKELSLEEAKSFPQRNVITRAMQPHMERRSRADVYHTDDIRAGDYFMLCTDGMLEQMEDENLKFIFSDEGGDAAHKSDMLVKVTAHNIQLPRRRRDLRGWKCQRDGKRRESMLLFLGVSGRKRLPCRLSEKVSCGGWWRWGLSCCWHWVVTGFIKVGLQTRGRIRSRGINSISYGKYIDERDGIAGEGVPLCD